MNGTNPPKIEVGDLVRFKHLNHCPDMYVSRQPYKHQGVVDVLMVDVFWFDKNWAPRRSSFRTTELRIERRAPEVNPAPKLVEVDASPKVELPCDVERSDDLADKFS